MPTITIVIDCLNADRSHLEGFSGKSHGLFVYDADRTTNYRKQNGGADRVCSVRLTVDEFRKCRKDIFDIPRNSSYPTYLFDVEVTEDEPVAEESLGEPVAAPVAITPVEPPPAPPAPATEPPAPEAPAQPVLEGTDDTELTPVNVEPEPAPEAEPEPETTSELPAEEVAPVQAEPESAPAVVEEPAAPTPAPEPTPVPTVPAVAKKRTDKKKF
jgi:hypothetical protein